MALTFSTYEETNDVVLSISGQLDALSTPELMPTIEKLMDTKQNDILVDLNGLDLIDSSGVAALVALFRRGKAKGFKVSFMGVKNHHSQSLNSCEWIKFLKLTVDES